MVDSTHGDPLVFESEAPVCDLCGRQLELIPDAAGRHPSVRLICVEHGARLMWTPFGDDAQSSAE